MIGQRKTAKFSHGSSKTKVTKVVDERGKGDVKPNVTVVKCFRRERFCGYGRLPV